MTTYDLLFDRPVEKQSGPVAKLKRAWVRFQRRRKETATIIELSRLDARLLRDVGIEPMDVYDALHGGRRSILFNPWRRGGLD